MGCRTSRMKFLCLAYGSERDWKALSKDRQDELLAQDEVIRRRGAYVAPVSTTVTSVRGESVTVENSAETNSPLPLAGFSIIEADNVAQVVELVRNTPCAQANGVIEIRAIHEKN